MVAHVIQDNGPEERAEEPHEKSCLHVSDVSRSCVSVRHDQAGTGDMSSARRYYSSNELAEGCSNELATVIEQKIWPHSLVQIASNSRWAMPKFLLRVAAIVLFCSFAAVSGAFASTHDGAVVSSEGAPLGMTTDETVDNVSESTDNADPLVSNPAEYQTCMNACKGGSAAMLRYCTVFLDPRVKALCIIAAGGSFVACSGFCYARFMD